MNTFLKISIFICTFLAGILIGYSIHKFQPSFYIEIRNSFKRISSENLDGLLTDKIIQKDLIDRKFYTKDILNKINQENFINNKNFKDYFDLVTNATFDNYVNNKNNLKENFIFNNILDEGQVKFQIEKKQALQDFKKYYLPNSYKSSEFEIYKVKYYENYNFGVLHRSEKSKNKLIIYNQGHGGNSYHHQYFLDLKLKYLNEGYDILNLNMPIRGFNFLPNKYISFPVNPYKKLLPSVSLNYPFQGTKDHQVFRFFYDKNYPEKKPLSLFLSGNFYLIKNILSKNNYEKVKIIGHSGGGLQSIYYMFLFSEIKKGYISSGFFTKTHRLDQTGGDWEHYYSDFIINNNYFDLIYGSLIDEKKQFNRELIFQFNNLDPSCCGAPYSKNFVDLLNAKSKKLDLNIKAFFIDKNFHEIDLDTLYKNF